MIKRLLTLDPKERITTAEALEHAWMQDEEVIGKAKKIMETAATKMNVSHPPQIPVTPYVLILSHLLSMFPLYSHVLSPPYPPLP